MLSHSLIIIIILMKKKSQEFTFLLATERHFQSLAGPRNISVHFKYDVLAYEYLCMAYLFESGEVVA